MPIFVITDVALIPLSSQQEAKKAIDQAKQSLKKSAEEHTTSAEDSETSEDEELLAEDARVENAGQESPKSLGSPPKDYPPTTSPEKPDRGAGNVVENVIGKKGQYGRFAERWFSRKGWTTEKRRAQGMSTNEETPRSTSNQDTLQSSDHESAAADTDTVADMENPGQSTNRDNQDQPLQSPQSAGHTTNVANTLLPKLLRTTRILLGSRSFFFSYDLDITRRLGSQNLRGSEIPLYKAVDPLVSCRSSLYWSHSQCGLIF